MNLFHISGGIYLKNKFKINGKLASEFTENLPEAKRLTKGMIQLQLHDPGMIVEFKNIYLKVLK